MKSSRAIGWILLIGGAALLPVLFKGAYVHHVLVMCLIFGFSALGLNLIFGFAGQAAFGLPAFFALGGYISALLAIRLGLPFWVALPGTMVLSAMFGLLIGYPCLHLRGIYFGITTMAFAQILYYIASNWISLTRGPMGLVGVPVPRIHLGSFDFEFETGFKYYYLVLAAIVVTVWLLRMLMKTPLGRAFVAIRENEDLASSIGIHPFWIKMIAFMLACTITAVGGSFYAHFSRFMSPNEFQWYYIGLTFIMVITGGMGTVMGPVIGAVIFTVLPEVFRAIEQYRNILTGTLLILVVIFFPEGIMGLVNRRLERKRPVSSPPPSRGGEVDPV
jgi:branched-chain amino acid transport system permease protein